MVQLNERNKLLKDFCITEAELKRLKALGHDDATWRNQHEKEVQLAWVIRRYDFIQAEIDALLPPKPKRERDASEGPIVSHRVGRPGTAGLSTYGEQFG